MTLHRIAASQRIPRPLDEVFAFFADPENLARLTPPSMGFEFLTPDRDMRLGFEIDYRIRPLLGIPTAWQTRITAWDPPHAFTDIQARGPYRSWEHRHAFKSVDGGTLIRDQISYQVPFGLFGDVVNRLVIRGELARIFRYRAEAIRTIFAEPELPPTGLSIAVAGGTGFVGGGIAQELFRRGHRVVVLSRRGEAARGGLPDAIEIRRTDVTTGEGLEAAMRGVERLAIALAFRNSPIEAPRRHQTFEEVDAAGTEHLVRAARAAGVDRVVYVSGAGAAPDAPRHWFRAKWRAEEAIRASGMSWTILRPTWIYGPRDVSLNRFVGFARRLGVVPLTNSGRQLLAPVFVDDAARLAADSLVEAAAANQVFELGGPEVLRFRDIVGTALRVARVNRPIVPGPTPLIKLVAAPLALLPEPLLTPAAVDFINQPAVVDIGPLLERMPRRLTPLEEGLRTYLDPASAASTIVFDR